MRKKLVKYLADYLQTEVERNNGVFDANNFYQWIEQGLEAFESIEGVVIDAFPKLGDKKR